MPPPAFYFQAPSCSPSFVCRLSQAKRVITVETARNLFLSTTRAPGSQSTQPQLSEFNHCPPALVLPAIVMNHIATDHVYLRLQPTSCHISGPSNCFGQGTERSSSSLRIMCSATLNALGPLPLAATLPPSESSHAQASLSRPVVLTSPIQISVTP